MSGRALGGIVTLVLAIGHFMDHTGVTTKEKVVVTPPKIWDIPTATDTDTYSGRLRVLEEFRDPTEDVDYDWQKGE